MNPKKIIIIGGGFAGLNAAKALKNAPVDILLIDKTNHHLFQPLLYQVASAALSPGEIAIPIREVLRKQSNVTVVMGNVTSIDKEKKKVHLSHQEEYSYDYLIVSPGARHSYFGHDAWEEFAPGLKTVQDALKIRESILLSFEKAECTESLEEREKYLNFIIIGGGPTGVEMAGAIAEISRQTLRKNFRKINPEKAKIYLIEAAPRILPMYPESLSLRAKRDLEKLGVTVLEGAKVIDVSSNGVQIEKGFFSSHNVLWAAGNQASSLLKTLNVPLDRQGRVIVKSDLSLPDDDSIFVIGDAACVLGKDQKPLPSIAPVAIQQGKYVAKLLSNFEKERRPFSYFDKGSMATIGRGKAIVSVGKLKFTGIFAWLMWCFVHIAYLIGFRNRLSVMIEWIFCYLTGKRGSRLIYGEKQDISSIKE
ncbi:NAD(P)/FAD-dependent oxidoreductase [Rhabdochlamydiaceae symbiont of Dictyostelium giganteum]|uniref:NAD(P)/FAD-dependent oxidoreductase n=1 Tax=Rhabdochlamydiaceae symbiont of Dictyostelium giganteum TaxID=3342349 RepID=UPI00384A9D1A